MKTTVFFVFLLSFIGGSAGLAMSECRQKLEPLRALASTLPVPDPDFHQFPRRPAVSLGESVVVNEQGEGFFLLHRVGVTWRSSSGGGRFAVHSDPTWPISILGANLASFLGLRLNASDQLQVPNAKYLSQRIQELNLRLKKIGLEPIPIQFNDSLNSVVSTELPLAADRPLFSGNAERFVAQFIQTQNLPLTKQEIIHDTSHHLVDILFTSDQLAAVRARGLELLKFARYLRSHHPESFQFEPFSQSGPREALLNYMFQSFSREIDNLMGSVPVEILKGRHLRGDFERNSLTPEAQESFFNRWVSKFQKREDSLPSKKLKSWREQSDYFKFYFLQIGEAMAGGLGRLGTPPQKRDITLMDWLESFIEKRIIFSLVNPKLASRGNQSIDYFLHQGKRRGGMDELLIHSRSAANELTKIFESYKKIHPDSQRIVLAHYNKEGEVLGGLAAKEKVLESFERRIKELQMALSRE